MQFRMCSVGGNVYRQTGNHLCVKHDLLSDADLIVSSTLTVSKRSHRGRGWGGGKLMLCINQWIKYAFVSFWNRVFELDILRYIFETFVNFKSEHWDIFPMFDCLLTVSVGAGRVIRRASAVPHRPYWLPQRWVMWPQPRWSPLWISVLFTRWKGASWGLSKVNAQISAKFRCCFLSLPQKWEISLYLKPEYQNNFSS